MSKTYNVTDGQIRFIAEELVKNALPDGGGDWDIWNLPDAIYERIEKEAELDRLINVACSTVKRRINGLAVYPSKSHSNEEGEDA